MSGHQTLRTLHWIIMSGRYMYARSLSHALAKAQKRGRAQGCPAVNLGWVATELSQEGSAEFHQETASMC